MIKIAIDSPAGPPSDEGASSIDTETPLYNRGPNLSFLSEADLDEQVKRLTEKRCATKIIEVIPRVMQVLRNEMRLNAATDLTVPQYRILNQLGKSVKSPGELAEWVGVSLPAVSRMVDFLGEKGLVKKTRSKTDGRAFSLSLTAKGRRTLERVKTGTQNHIVKQLIRVPDEKRILLMNGLEILRELFLRKEELP